MAGFDRNRNEERMRVMASETVRKTVEISSNIHGGCVHCGAATVDDSSESITDGVNHYIEKHGYRLLHVGQQSSWAPDGKQVWYATVAVLGHDNPPAEMPPAKVVFKDMG